MAESKRKAYTIKELRELAGLSQQELGWKAGMSSAYISQIESGKKILSYEAALKITEVFIRLMNEGSKIREGDEQLEYQIEQDIENETREKVSEVMANHVASNYEEKIQSRILELMEQIDVAKSELEEILETGREAEELEPGYRKDIKDFTLYDLMEILHSETVSKNAFELKLEYQNQRKDGTKLPKKLF